MSNNNSSRKINNTSLGLAIGLVFGGGIGLALGNLAFAGGGMVIGLAIGAALDSRSKENNA
jgi:hypothetical protein